MDLGSTGPGDAFLTSEIAGPIISVPMRAYEAEPSLKECRDG